jgi:formylglycine-generating enzyme required for sulfatase activity
MSLIVTIFSITSNTLASPQVMAGVGYEYVLIAKDTFEMGCTKEQKKVCSSDERSKHKVTLTSDFYMMKAEVSQGLYESILDDNPSSFKLCGSKCPVEQVSWYDAVYFANQLSKKEGLEPCYVIDKTDVRWPKGLSCKGWRLPTEAEWEYAARGNEKYKYAGSDDIQEVSWYGHYLEEPGTSKEETTHPSCKMKSNQFGLCDMSGNVYEWVWDWYEAKYYSNSPDTDPIGPEKGAFKVDRGGSWVSGNKNSRTSDRDRSVPTLKRNNLGFRLTRTAQ